MPAPGGLAVGMAPASASIAGDAVATLMQQQQQQQPRTSAAPPPGPGLWQQQQQQQVMVPQPQPAPYATPQQLELQGGAEADILLLEGMDGGASLLDPQAPCPPPPAQDEDAPPDADVAANTAAACAPLLTPFALGGAGGGGGGGAAAEQARQEHDIFDALFAKWGCDGLPDMDQMPFDDLLDDMDPAEGCKGIMQVRGRRRRRRQQQPGGFAARKAGWWGGGGVQLHPPHHAACGSRQAGRVDMHACVWLAGAGGRTMSEDMQRMCRRGAAPNASPPPCLLAGLESECDSAAAAVSCLVRRRPQH